YFTPPIHTFTIAEGENLLALAVFLAVAAVVSTFVSLASRRAADGARDRAEAEALAGLAGSSPVPDLLETLPRQLGLDAAVVYPRAPPGWHLEHAAGSPTPESPGDMPLVEIDDEHALAIIGAGATTASATRVLAAFTRELRASIELAHLQAEA